MNIVANFIDLPKAGGNFAHGVVVWSRGRLVAWSFGRLKRVDYQTKGLRDHATELITGKLKIVAVAGQVP